jgi:DNA-binding transcriptional ArsR family regulator
VTKHGERIIAALRTTSPQTPRDLAKALKLARPALAYHMRPLLKSRAVLATGHTGNRQFTLPPRTAAKEAP